MKEGWTYKKLGEVCEIFGRIGFRGYTKADLVDSPNDGAITLSPSNIVNGEMDYSKCSYITWAKYEESPEIMIYPGDILLVKTASVGKTALVRDLPHKATINPQFVVFKNIETNHDYLSYYMKSEKAQKYIWSIAKGAAAQTVSQKNLAEMQVPVPTKAEQQRIVSRLDAAFAHIDELKANAEKQLSEARALFQKALTKAMKPKEGWKEKELGDIVFYFSGYAFESKGYTNNNDDVLLICGDNIVHCDFRWETIKHWPKEEYKDLKRFSLEENDIVLAMDRPWVKSGLKIAKVSPKELPSLLIQRTACIRAPKDISSDFIFYSLQTDKYIKHLVSQQTGVGVPHISGKQILSYKISIPNFKEQQRIVSRLDSLSAHVRELEEVLQKTIAECNALKQALLRKVFE